MDWAAEIAGMDEGKVWRAGERLWVGQELVARTEPAPEDGRGTTGADACATGRGLWHWGVGRGRRLGPRAE
jgi:hypothetical protein